ncbi:hypothetical protein TWF481_001191 [Arthrobotrys musiformis]|uniref:F-box domain-containing protein n=1 Tax=Arthrobotrys musiformis TaxID=47236 RepID=A0AAV9WPZ0_9PEZI
MYSWPSLPLSGDQSTMRRESNARSPKTHIFPFAYHSTPQSPTTLPSSGSNLIDLSKMSLSKMPPEIAYNIVSNLDDLDDLVCLMKTSRYMHSIGHGRLRQRIDETLMDFATETKGWSPPTKGGLESSWKEDSKSFSVSFEIKTKRAKYPRKTSNLDSEQFLEAMVKQLTKKKNNPNIIGAVELSNAKILTYPGISRAFKLLFMHSFFTPAEKFGITSLTTDLSLHDIRKHFDTKKLTKLDLTFSTTFWEYDYSKIGVPLEKSVCISPKIGTVREIKVLKNIILRCPNLESLSLKPQVGPLGVTVPLTVPRRVFAQLEKAVMGLGKLHTLEISGYLFHPSFFLPVPENVKTLKYHNCNKLSPEWWSKFSEAALTNVEDLDIHIDGTRHLPGFYREAGGGFTSSLSQNLNGFVIGDVKVKTLKQFGCKLPTNPCLPRDLVECIERNNPGLDEKESDE